MDHSYEQDQTTIQVDAPPSEIVSPPFAAGCSRFIFSGGASIAALLIFVLLVRSLAAYHVTPLGVVPQPTNTPTAVPTATEAITGMGRRQ